MFNRAAIPLLLDPSGSSAHTQPFPSLVEIAGTTFPAITFTLATMSDDVSVTVEVSSDFIHWNPNTTEVSRAGLGIETVTVRANDPVQPAFLRLRIAMLAAPP